MSSEALESTELASFRKNGYLVIPGMVDDKTCDAMRAVAVAHTADHVAPIEYEVDVQYPGSPANFMAEGGQTPRRLLNVYARDQLFRDWPTSDRVHAVLSDFFGGDNLVLSQCHHNCMMTKHPGFSSATLWHQDSRYWSFDERNLISSWLALGDETRENGCLRVIPGSHELMFEPGRFDAALFLRPDLEENKSLMSQAVKVELKQGDVLFFHSRLFHAAGRNLSEQVKYSLVYTYHEASNMPIVGTRSARSPGISLNRAR